MGRLDALPSPAEAADAVLLGHEPDRAPAPHPRAPPRIRRVARHRGRPARGLRGPPAPRLHRALDHRRRIVGRPGGGGAGRAVRPLVPLPRLGPPGRRRRDPRRRDAPARPRGARGRAGRADHGRDRRAGRRARRGILHGDRDARSRRRADGDRDAPGRRLPPRASPGPRRGGGRRGGGATGTRAGRDGVGRARDGADPRQRPHRTAPGPPRHRPGDLGRELLRHADPHGERRRHQHGLRRRSPC